MVQQQAWHDALPTVEKARLKTVIPERYLHHTIMPADWQPPPNWQPSKLQLLSGWTPPAGWRQDPSGQWINPNKPGQTNKGCGGKTTAGGAARGERAKGGGGGDGRGEEEETGGEVCVVQ